MHNNLSFLDSCILYGPRDSHFEPLRVELRRLGFFQIQNCASVAEFEESLKLIPNSVIIYLYEENSSHDEDALFEVFHEYYRDENTTFLSASLESSLSFFHFCNRWNFLFSSYLLAPFNEKTILHALHIASQSKSHINKSRQIERLFSSIFKSSFDINLGFDHHNCLLYANQNANDFLGGLQQDTLGKFLDELLHFSSFPQHDTLHIHPGIFDLIQKDKILIESLFAENHLHKKPFFISLRIQKIHHDSTLSYIMNIQNRHHELILKENVEWYRHHDPTTRLLNRTSFAEELRKSFEKPTGETSMFFMLSILSLRFINMTLGAQSGDLTLFRIAHLILETLENYPHSIAGRLGGDDFAFFIPEIAKNEALGLAYEIQQKISLLHTTFESFHAKQIISQIALVPLKKHELIVEEAEEMISFAETGFQKTLYSQGHQQIKVFDFQRQIKEKEQSYWIYYLNKAIDNNLFRIFYQEIRPLHENLPTIFEILIRLHDEKGHFIQPSNFIQTAEHHEMMHKIDMWMISQALSKYHNFRKVHDDTICFSINISGKTIRQPEIVRFIQAQLERYQVPPQALIIEITETALIEDRQRVGLLIEELAQLGVACALDDFGSGYTSFSSLRDLPVKIIKIDGTYIRHLNQDKTNFSVVRYLKDFAKSMQMITVAEFVEDEETAKTLQEIGIDYGQGFYWSTPQAMNTED